MQRAISCVSKLKLFLFVVLAAFTTNVYAEYYLVHSSPCCYKPYYRYTSHHCCKCYKHCKCSCKCKCQKHYRCYRHVRHVTPCCGYTYSYYSCGTCNIVSCAPYRQQPVYGSSEVQEYAWVPSPYAY